MEVTKREALASVGIVGIMLVIGLLISGKIWEAKLDQDQVYQAAAQITESRLFQYGMRTSLGPAFVYGNLEAVDTVSYPEIDGEYMAIKKVKERYTKHKKEVRHTREKANGKTEVYYTTETYWTWDQVSSEEKSCKEISFCDTVFQAGKIELPPMEYIETIKESSKIRYKYYGTGVQFAGTIFTDLQDGSISDNSPFYRDKDIEAALADLESWDWRWVFWPFWIVLTAAAVYGFCYYDNKWLE